MQRKTWSFLSLALCAVVLGESARGSDLATASEDAAWPGQRFVYKRTGGEQPELEICFPDNWNPSRQRAPAVLLFHGGNWKGGSLSQFRYACRHFARRGLVAATATYRRHSRSEMTDLPAGTSRKRICITDAKSAIRWMKKNATELGVDPQRIIVGGASAGGHIAVLATANPGLNDPTDPAAYDTQVAALLLFNPAFSTRDRSDPEVDALAHVKADFPPTLVIFGTEDRWLRGGEAFVQKLKALGNTTVELWLAKGQDHGFFQHPRWKDVALAAADRFLARHGLLSGGGESGVAARSETLIKAP